MNLIPSKVGADPKKIAILAGLVLVAGYFYFSNSNSGGGSASTPIVSRAPVATPGTAPRVGGPIHVPACPASRRQHAGSSGRP